MRHPISALLSSRYFLPLFLAQFIAAFGDNLIRTTIVTIITYHSDDLSNFSRSLLITLCMALFMLPFIFGSATSGQIADKMNKAKLIRWTKFCSIFITIIGVIGCYTHNYTLMLLSVFLTGIDATVFGPVKFSILPDHLEKDDLLRANGLIEAAVFTAILLGMMLGVYLISVDSNIHPVIASITLVCVSAAGFVVTLFIPDTKRGSVNKLVGKNIIRETIENINYAKKDRDTFLAILGISWFWLIGGIFISQMPSFTRDALASDNSVFMLLLAVFTIGTAIGSLLCDKLLKGQIDVQYVPLSMLCMTVFMFLIWFLSGVFTPKETLQGIHYFLSKPAGLGITLSIGAVAIFGGIYIVPLYALLQIRARRTHRSRIIATNNIMNGLFLVAASVLAMMLLAINLSVSDLILILTISNFITTVYIARLLPDNIIKAMFQMLFRLCYRVEVIGMENFYKAGDRVLIIANHASFLDPPILGTFLPKRLVFAIDTYQAQSWYIKPFLTYLRAYPIDPTNPMATKTLIEKVKENNPVVIFPEGRLTVTGSLMKIYEGPALVADKADAKLLPIRIDGPQYTPFARLKGKIKQQLFPKITITIMPPEKIQVDENIVARERRHLLGKALYEIMTRMMFEGNKNESTIFESVIAARDQFGANYTILEDADNNKLTYKKLLTSAFVLASELNRRTAPKEHVGVFLPNAAGAAALFFSIILSGRIPAMLNYSTGMKNLISCCKVAGVKKIYTSERFIEKADLYHIIKGFTSAGFDIVYLESVRKSLNIFHKLSGLLKSYFPSASFKEMNKKNKISVDDPAVILFTSGSEGTPKAVALSHRNILSNIAQCTCKVDFSQNDKVFNALPIFHSFGLTAGMILPVISGVCVYLYPSPLHYRIIPEMIYATNSTILFGTDTFLSGYAQHAHPYDLFAVRYIFAGAEKLRAATRQTYMEKFGVRIFEGYGVTEASPAISLNTSMHYKSGTVGMLLPAMKYYIDKVEGIERGGRFIVNGPNIMLGYMKNEHEIIAPSYMINGELQEGWYDTGDIVDVDNEGFITILGRAKRFAKIAGEMLSLTVIEESILAAHPDAIIAAVNIPDDKKGEVIILFTNSELITKNAVHALFKSIGLAEIYVPRIVKFMSDIPVLATGKVDYVTLKERALEIVNSDI